MDEKARRHGWTVHQPSRSRVRVKYLVGGMSRSRSMSGSKDRDRNLELFWVNWVRIESW